MCDQFSFSFKSLSSYLDSLSVICSHKAMTPIQHTAVLSAELSSRRLRRSVYRVLFMRSLLDDNPTCPIPADC